MIYVQPPPLPHATRVHPRTVEYLRSELLELRLLVLQVVLQRLDLLRVRVPHALYLGEVLTEIGSLQGGNNIMRTMRTTESLHMSCPFEDTNFDERFLS